MTDLINIINKKGSLKIIGTVPIEAKFLLKKTIEDIGDKIEATAKIYAPDADPDGTGAKGFLRQHPVDRTKIIEGVVKPTAFAFGGGLSVRGRTGFIGSVPETRLGDEVALEKITVTDKIYYARFVHEGTGLYGPFRRPYGPVRASRMTFFAYGRRFALKEVKGQKANPYLQKAYDNLNVAYIPAKIEALRAKIAAVA